MQTVRKQLVEALEFERQISEANDPEAYPQFVEMRDKALDRARAEPEEQCKSTGYLLPCDTSCPCYQEGLKAQREPAGRGTA